MMIIMAVDDAKLQATLGGFSVRLIEEMQKAMERYTVYLQATVKTKLTDDVLRVRSGTLRRSINREVSASATGVQGVVGTPVRYGSVHEYGFHGTAWVSEHVRRVTTGHKTPMTISKARIGKIGEKRLRYINGMATVKGHFMNMNLPERSFLRSSLKETIPMARDLFAEATKKALQP